MSYNGWENRETWNASLWINNEEILYNLAHDIANDNSYCMMSKVETLVDFLEVIWKDGKTPDGDDLSSVVWEDVLNGMKD